MDVLEELENLLPKVPAGVERRRVGAHLNSTLLVIKEIDGQIARLDGCIAVLREAGVARSRRINDDLNELLDEADDVARRMISAKVSDDVRAVAELYPKFVRSLAIFERALRGEVRGVMEGEFSGLLAIGRVFESIDGTADLGLRIVSCAEEAYVCTETVGIDQLASTIRRLRERRTALDSERDSKAETTEVGVFLNALVEQQATLRMVTAPVRQWLEDHGALDNFVVRGA